jgi:hypothetical protein
VVGRLRPEDVRRIAEATADVLAERGLIAPAAPELVDAREVARRFSLTADFVRRHAADLGGVKVSDRPKAPWRFDPAEVAVRLSAFSAAERPEARDPSPSPAPARRNSPRRRRTTQGTDRTLAGGELDVRRVPSMAKLVADRRGALDLDVGARDDRGGKRNGAAARERPAPGGEG